MSDVAKRIEGFLIKRMPDVLLDGFFLGAELIPQKEPGFGPETGLTARIELSSPCPGEFFLCAPYPPVRMLCGALLGSTDDEDADDILAELANIVAGRIALDLQGAFDHEPKIGLPKVGQDLFPSPGSLDIHLRFRVEGSHLAVGWKGNRP